MSSWDFDYSEYYEEEHRVKTIAWSTTEVRKVHITEAVEKKKEFAPYFDIETNEEVIPRKCIDKVNHYAFKPQETPIATKKESELHQQCKNEILADLIRKIPNGQWDKERPIPQIGRRPDISGRIFKDYQDTKGWPVVIEVQASTLPIEEIIRRTKDYSTAKCYILWVLPLVREFDKEEYRPRLMEALLHSMYYGRVYYWVKGMGSLVRPVHYEKAERYIESSTWYSEEGEEQSAGGYNKPYKLIKRLNTTDPMDIAENFSAKPRNAFSPKVRKLPIPECKIFHDRRPTWWTN